MNSGESFFFKFLVFLVCVCVCVCVRVCACVVLGGGGGGESRGGHFLDGSIFKRDLLISCRSAKLKQLLGDTNRNTLITDD